MRTVRRTTTLALAAAAALGVTAGAAATAQADTLLSAAPGARNLAQGGGYAAWAARAADGRWQLVVRNAEGAVAPAAIRTFGAPPDASLGASAFAASKHIVAVYSRCSGTSSTTGCDVYQLDLTTGRESRIAMAATRAYSETSPSIASGRIGFVRRGGTRNGVYVAVPGYDGGAWHLNRVDGHIARELAVSQSRIAYLYRNTKGKDDVTLAQLDGTRRRLMTRATPGVLFNPVITRYRVGWLERRDTQVIAKMTDRINPSDTEPTVRTGKRPLPASTNSAVTDSSAFDAYLDAEGYKHLSPPLFPSYG